MPMSRKYKFHRGEALYFTTTSVINWFDVFTRTVYKSILIDSLQYCQREKDLDIYAWCLMTNHLHLIIGTRGRPLSDTMRDMKHFTAKRLLEAIAENKEESRRSWLMYHFERAGRYRAGNDQYQFWQHGNHPIELIGRDMLFQKRDYIHDNPVKAGFVVTPEDWLYSSAGDYAGKPGLLDVILIE